MMMLSTAVAVGDMSGKKNTFGDPSLQTNRERQTLNKINKKNT